MINLTESAAERINVLIGEHPTATALRVFVTGGGCSGFSYGFDFADETSEDDTTVETDGATVVIDPMSLMYLEGSTVDFKKDLSGEMFSISNPNATTTCGCGSSFSI